MSGNRDLKEIIEKIRWISGGNKLELSKAIPFKDRIGNGIGMETAYPRSKTTIGMESEWN